MLAGVCVLIRPVALPVLVAFAVGDWDVRDAGRAGRNDTPISIVVPKGRADEAAYAAANTGAILAATERFFGQPYPFPKLDLVAYPPHGGDVTEPKDAVASDEVDRLDVALVIERARNAQEHTFIAGLGGQGRGCGHEDTR